MIDGRRMIKNLLKIFLLFILGVVGGIFGSEILWPYFVERPLFYQYKLNQPPFYIVEKKEIIQENIALKEAIEKVEKVVIGLRTELPTGKIIEGSGLIITSDGLIVTLAQLIPQGAKFNFFINGERVHYQILKRDSKENLALVKIEKTNLPTVGFANLEKLKLGERVFLVGKIFIKEQMKTLVNEGVVKYFDQNLIETNIFEKNNLAGSILFDIEGNVVGINKVDSGGQIISLPVSKIRALTGF